jgi:hypothetical protein
MRHATKTIATLFGIVAGVAGLEHGIFEIMRGNTRPEGVMIASMGPPCNPEEVWNACEPAMTILPNFLITGILAVLIGTAVLVWSVSFITRRGGGLVLILLSVALLLFGGGLFPPLIGVLAAAAGTRINRPSRTSPPAASPDLSGGCGPGHWCCSWSGSSDSGPWASSSMISCSRPCISVWFSS